MPHRPRKPVTPETPEAERMPRAQRTQRLADRVAGWRARVPAGTAEAAARARAGLAGSVARLWRMRADLPRVPAGVLVAGLLTTAFIALGALASAASDAAPEEAAAATRAGGAGAAHGRGAARQDSLPADSGLGARVVYSLSQHKVWLVGADERVRRRYEVTSGAVAPPNGTHKVFARRSHGRGGDGREVEHAVFFAQVDNANVGFSAPVKPAPSTHPADPVKLGAAIREDRADGEALWLFATIGRTVEVIP
jgi:hypothetical protein